MKCTSANSEQIQSRMNDESNMHDKNLSGGALIGFANVMLFYIGVYALYLMFS